MNEIEKINSKNIILNLSLEKYPLLNTIKKEELDKFVLKVFDYGYNILYPELTDEIKYKSQLEALSKKEIIDSINVLKNEINDNAVDEKIEYLSQILEKFLGLSNNSNKKGEITEDIIYQIFTSKYKDLSYEKTRHIPHSGDGILIFPNKLKTLVEIKNYSTTIKKEEVEKFEYDMKFNNINFGIFISLKSSIQGHSQLSYNKMIHNNKEYHMVFVSHVNEELSKIDAALLVLNKLFELENKDIKKNNIEWIHSQINNHFKELIKISEKTSFLKDNYLDMESTIKSSLNNYYNILRDYQYEIDQKINEIWTKMNQDFGKIEKELIDQTNFDKILEINKDDKCFYILTKIFDEMKKYNLYLIDINSKLWSIKYKNEEIGEMKKTKSKIVISLNNPSIDIIFIKNKDDQNDQNIKFLQIILNDSL